MRILFLLLVLTGAAQAQDRSMILASTTSTQNSGLLDAILPVFYAATGIQVHVVAVGTGQAIRIAENGDADAILVHHRPSEDKFVSDGYGINRIDLMANDFVIVGPADDPALLHEASTTLEAFSQLYHNEPLFISRGDDSGTHLRELEIWNRTGLTPNGRWYLEVGTGMGAALNTASDLDAYIMTDRSTWLSFQNKQGLVLLYQGGADMLNPYGYIEVDSAKFPHVKAVESEELGAWLLSDEGQAAIAGFEVDGVQLFCLHGLSTPNQQDDQQARCQPNALQR